MHALIVVAKRELNSYFSSPLAYVFMFIFTLLACGAALLPEFDLFGRPFGGLLDKNNCSLMVFFDTLPFLLAFFAPAMAMKLWADERKRGTIELLFTYPLSATQIVLGKFVAAWTVLIIALLTTFPLVLLIGSIGKIHYPMLISGYLATILLAGAFTAIACAASALTSNSVVSLIVGVFACSVLIGINLLPFESGIMDSVCRFAGALDHFQSMVMGKIGIHSILYFVSIAIGCFFLNLFFLETK